MARAGGALAIYRPARVVYAVVLCGGRQEGRSWQSSGGNKS